MKRISLYFLSITAFLVLLLSCKKTNEGPNLNFGASVDISSFSVNASKGIIDTAKSTVTISLPFGTDFTKVSPTIVAAEGAIITPASGVSVNLSNPVQYRVVNGNVYKNYTVTARETPAILSFKGQGAEGVIDEVTRKINIIVPPGTDITKVTVQVSLASGATITPQSGSIIDFTNPVVFTIRTSTATVNYTVTAVDITAEKPVAFLGNYPTRNDISNGDELAAANWFFANYSKGEYVSLAAINNGTIDLKKYSLIWWHEDATQTLPNIAYEPAVVNSLKAYRNAGGNLLLTTFASRWIDALGIVPPFKGPNNVFGDAMGQQWQDNNNNWGFSINASYANHPIFAGLPRASDKSYPVVYLLDKVAFRLNHCSWWKVNEWGGYGDAAGWRNQTGGIDLAGPDGSDNTNSNVTIAEFPKTAGNGSTIVITPGSYDWYAEPNPTNSAPSPANSYLSNVQRLTKNAIDYLRKL